MDFSELVRGGKDNVLRGLDIKAVAGALGIMVDADVILCPFHQEDTPSFSIFIGDDGKQRAFCHGCGWRGDVIDFVRARCGLSYAEALAQCEEYLEMGLPAPQAPGAAEPVDLRKVYDDARQAGGLEVIHRWLYERGSTIDPAWLIERFRLAVNQYDEIVIPHYAPGADSPRAVKRRKGSAKAAYSGSRLTTLYGSWLDQRRQTVILCEGESDTWTVSWYLRNERVDVLGLPRGVGSQIDPEWLETLKGRHIILLFDADNPGRGGMRRWVDALRPVAESISLGLLPETTDASAVDEQELLGVLGRLVPAPNFADLPLLHFRGGYAVRKDLNTPPTPITDWTLTVLSRTEIPGETVSYTVRLPNGVVSRISHSDLRNPDTFSRWANPWGLAHSAGGSAVQHLLRLLEAESVYTPRRAGISVLGWHDGRIVLPDRTIGRQDLEFVPPAMDARWEQRLRLTEPPAGGVRRSVVPVLARLHTPGVMTPILGWLSAVPLRAMCPQFPTLAVMGSAGSGKTTIVDAALGTFGYSNGTPISISNSTWHGVWAMGASTNGLPVWFDEYRAGTRADGVAALEQMIRDAWNGAATMRGGVGENKSALHTMVATAPILVSGEGAFQEASHAERSVYVALSRHGRNPDALQELRRLDIAGLGLDYLRWLVHLGPEGIPAPPALPDRPAQAIAVARWGYDLLLRWLDLSDLADRMPAWDDSLVAKQQGALLASNPYLEALRECQDVVDGTVTLVWREGNDLIVRYGRIPTWVKQRTTIVLPGGERALLAWLQETYTVRVEQATSGRVARLIGAADTLMMAT